MKTTQALSSFPGKIGDSAREAGDHLNAATGAIGEGMREASYAATDVAKAAASDAQEIGKDVYRRAGDALSNIDQVVARNPVGALVAALGFGLVLGMMARR